MQFYFLLVYCIFIKQCCFFIFIILFVISIGPWPKPISTHQNKLANKAQHNSLSRKGPYSGQLCMALAQAHVQSAATWPLTYACCSRPKH